MHTSSAAGLPSAAATWLLKPCQDVLGALFDLFDPHSLPLVPWDIPKFVANMKLGLKFAPLVSVAAVAVAGVAADCPDYTTFSQVRS